MIRDLAVKAGITKRVYPHLFRHSFITNFLRAGGNPTLCSQIVGHETLAMITSTYQHLVVSDAAAELRVMPCPVGVVPGARPNFCLGSAMGY